MEAPRISTSSDLTGLLDKYSTFIFDCDGVLYKSADKIPHAFEFLKRLQADPTKKIVFLTNNSLYTRQDLSDRLKSIGGFEASVEQIYTASYIAAQYLKTHHKEVKKVYALGKQLLADELKAAGFEVLSSQAHNEQYEAFGYGKKADLDEFKTIDALVAAYDDKINYYKLTFASLCAQNNSVFLSTNNDFSTAFAHYPGYYLPGNGSFVKSIEASSGKTATVTGKPNPQVMSIIVSELGVDKSSCVFVGDNMCTDIQFANNCDIDSILVLTGVTTTETLPELLAKREKGETWQGERIGHPTYVLPNLQLE